MTKLHDLNGIARVSAIGTMVFMAGHVGYALFLFWYNRVYSAYLANDAGLAENAALDRVDIQLGYVSLAFLVLNIVVFAINGRWIYLASANAAFVVPSEERIRPGWAVGWFFIPIANLWMPFTAMKQTWAASVGGGKLESALPGWFTLWWISWVVLNLLDGASGQIGTSPFSTPEDYINGNTYTAIIGLLWLIPSYLFMRLIKTVTENQRSASDVFA